MRAPHLSRSIRSAAALGVLRVGADPLGCSLALQLAFGLGPEFQITAYGPSAVFPKLQSSGPDLVFRDVVAQVPLPPRSNSYRHLAPGCEGSEAQQLFDARAALGSEFSGLQIRTRVAE
jgi:hypothetical protein